MATGVLDNVYLKFDGAITGLYASASSGISSYVIPIAWIVLAVLLLVWCYLTMTGKTSMPVLDLFVPFIAFMLVLYAMGSGYTAWIADPLYKLPEELVSAVGRGSATTPIQALALFEEKFIGLATGGFNLLVDYVKSLAWGAAILLAIVLLIMIIAAVIMMVVIFCGLVYAKLGLTLVLAVGPFFVFLLVLQHTRDKFFSWLNTALFFVFYYVLCFLFMNLFFNFLDAYINALAGVAANSGAGVAGTIADAIRNQFMGGDMAKAGNVIVLFMPVVLLTLIMAFMFLQLSTIASSMTSGAGGAVRRRRAPCRTPCRPWHCGRSRSGPSASRGPRRTVLARCRPCRPSPAPRWCRRRRGRRRPRCCGPVVRRWTRRWRRWR